MKAASAPTTQSSPGPAGDGAPARSPSRLRRFAREWVLPLAVVLAVLLPLRSAVADWNDVPTGSMRPTILEGDRIWVNKLAYGLRVPFTTTWVARWSDPGRGDIVTFASPAGGQRMVKRVIGLPGDHIALVRNRLIVNGEPVGYELVDAAASMTLPDGRDVHIVIASETLPGGGGGHAITLTPGAQSPSTVPGFVVPEGAFFLMGDNRDQSLDSRMLGFVPREDIYGRSGFIALSLDPENWYMPRLGRWLSRLP